MIKVMIPKLYFFDFLFRYILLSAMFVESCFSASWSWFWSVIGIFPFLI